MAQKAGVPTRCERNLKTAPTKMPEVLHGEIHNGRLTVDLSARRERLEFGPGRGLVLSLLIPVYNMQPIDPDKIQLAGQAVQRMK